MAYITVYQGAARVTYEKIQKDINEIIINKVYESKTAKCLFYINNKGYMHILTPGRYTMNGKTAGYTLQDHILTKNNMMQYKTDYTKTYNTIEELQNAILNIIKA